MQQYPLPVAARTSRGKGAKSGTSVDAERQLAAFFAEYDATVSALGRDAVAKMRTYLPDAFQLVYDNYNALVVGFGPTDRASDAVLSIALYPRWVNLFFLRGTRLSDPAHLLKGDGKQVRSIRLYAASDLDRREIRDLILSARREAEWEPGSASEGRLIIKAIASKRRSRRASSGA